MGGRGSGSRMGSRSSGGGGFTNRNAATIGEMSSADRRQFLDDAPIGTEITGLISIRTGNEVTVEKVGGYRAVYGGVGAGSRIEESYWSVDGARDPSIARTLRTAAEGTNRYYRVRR